MPLVSEGEEELELSLGLSIGGSLKKSQMPKLVFQKSVSPSRLSSEIDFDGRDSMPLAASIGSQESNGGEDIFPREMEMHAFRRQEARKRREKQQKKRLFRKMGVLANNPLNPAIGISGSDLAVFEAQKLESRARDRSYKEIDETERISEKKIRKSGGESFGEENETLSQNPDPNSYPNPNSAFPVMAMQYPLHPIHYFVPPFGREGYSFPYVMPYWAAPQVAMPVSEGLYPEKKAFSPASFTPSATVDFGQNNTVCSVGEDLEGGGGKGTFSGSHGSTNSHVLDNQSSSLDGGIASEMAERASPLHNSQAQSEHSASTHLLEESAPQLVEQPSSNPLPLSSPSRPDNSTAQTILTATPKGPPNEIEAKKPLKQVEPTISNDTSKTPTPYSDHRHDHEGEVKKPLTQLEPRLSASLTPHMPCVSTTGNGPNGKTITGFLYSYTKTDVSIVCVCHGKVFSPAEFVKHAGGTDVSHPLKHIVVVPAAFEMK